MTPAELRIGVLAGEASGDILGSRVVRALRQHQPGLRVEGMGGPLLAEQGLDSLFPMERLSVMGFVEPLKRLPELLRTRGAVFEHFRSHPPDFFLGIDSPDFNLALERKLRAWGVPTAHLVSPTVWAWRERRIHKIARSIDLMLCLIPFEPAIYHQHGVDARFVGHPLADEIPMQPDQGAARAALNLSPSATVLALLPGSRGGEVSMLAPLFLEAASTLKSRFPELQFLVPAANAQRMEQLRALVNTSGLQDITLVDGRSREVMLAANAVLMASGTATLEALLLKRPMVVTYRMAPVSWALVRRLATTPFAALPNILAGESLVPELLQEAATPESMVTAVSELLETNQDAQVQRFEAIHESLRLGFEQRCADALLELAASHRHG